MDLLFACEQDKIKTLCIDEDIACKIISVL